MTIDDAPRLREHTQRAPSFGCDAKLVIHPLQVAGVHEAMAPCAEALDWVQRVIAADAPVPPCNWTAAWSMRQWCCTLAVRSGRERWRRAAP